jgi:hypothetical protein
MHVTSPFDSHATDATAGGGGSVTIRSSRAPQLELLAVALDFETWRTLVRSSGLSVDEAIDVMTAARVRRRRPAGPYLKAASAVAKRRSRWYLRASEAL